MPRSGIRRAPRTIPAAHVTSPSASHINHRQRRRHRAMYDDRPDSPTLRDKRKRPVRSRYRGSHHELHRWSANAGVSSAENIRRWKSFDFLGSKLAGSRAGDAAVSAGISHVSRLNIWLAPCSRRGRATARQAPGHPLPRLVARPTHAVRLDGTWSYVALSACHRQARKTGLARGCRRGRLGQFDLSEHLADEIVD
jgi:hypothetical protein